MDHTSVHPSCVHQAHLIDLHLWRGPPENRDESRPVEILVNHGYVVGFCPERLQPAWSAYRVAFADDDVDYDRPLSYYDDMRLEPELRIGRRTFGKLGRIPLNVGHMTPNEVINRQFGRLAQLETFLMSNMSPQYGSLNSGVWLRLENAIRKIKDEKGKDHVWAIVGPVFGDQPATINRGRGKHLPVPEKYFCVTVDPHTYPYDTPSRVAIDCFLIPQDAPAGSSPQDYPATLEEIERATRLNFFRSWGRELPAGAVASMADESYTESRMTKALRDQRDSATPVVRAAESVGESDTMGRLLDALRTEAAAIQKLPRVLTTEEACRVKTIQHTISWLIRARGHEPGYERPSGATMLTYKIVSDLDDRLRQGARTACNFWNRFVRPSRSIVVRLGIFTQNSNTIARAYEPYEKDETRYGVVEFNTKYLAGFDPDRIAGTIAHEIGHSLGMGWDPWHALYNRETGRFNSTAVKKLRALELMEVEREYGRGTAFSHWDEALFDAELMTGFQDVGEHVLPVTIDLMGVLGHTVIEPLEEKKPLAALLDEAARVVFSRQDEVRGLDRDHFVETPLLETIPHRLGEESDQA